MLTYALALWREVGPWEGAGRRGEGEGKREEERERERESRARE